MTRRIMLIHPEGNFRNNPSLSGIIEILAEQGYQVDVYCPLRAGLDQSPPCAGVRVFNPSVDRKGLEDYSVIFLTPSEDPINEYRQIILEKLPVYDLIIGVDRGIVEASIISQILEKPLGLISYEIWFERETSTEFKYKERMACRNLSFAVCQDNIRSTLLSIENDLSPELLINIPVAGRKYSSIERDFDLHDRLGIPHSEKVALYIGDLASAWSGIYEILPRARNFPSSWHLVLHHRYGQEHLGAILHILKQAQLPNVHVSPYPSLSFEALPNLLCNADLGFVNYLPLAGDITANDNLRFIGMASGKASSYLQHGVPVLINQVGELSNKIREFHVGHVIEGFDQLPDALANLEQEQLTSLKRNCKRFFEHHLSLDKTVSPLLDKLESLLR